MSFKRYCVTWNHSVCTACTQQMATLCWEHGIAAGDVTLHRSVFLCSVINIFWHCETKKGCVKLDSCRQQVWRKYKKIRSFTFLIRLAHFLQDADNSTFLYLWLPKDCIIHQVITCCLVSLPFALPFLLAMI